MAMINDLMKNWSNKQYHDQKNLTEYNINQENPGAIVKTNILVDCVATHTCNGSNLKV